MEDQFEDLFSEYPPKKRARMDAMFQRMCTDALWLGALTDKEYAQAWDEVCGDLDHWWNEAPLPLYCEQTGADLRLTLTEDQDMLLDDYVEALSDVENVRLHVLYRKGLGDGQRQKG